jgi:hypothetical protein
MGQTAETNSLEVRWFGEDSPPAALDEWIAGLGSVDTTARTDRYLSPVHPSCNLKLRSEDGEFVELKRRLGEPDRRSFGPDVVGQVEQWYKWSFSLDHRPGLWETDRTGLWVPVEKTRTLHAVDDAELRSLEPSDGLTGTDVTAQVELTEVTVLSETAWTCGVEVAGSVDELEDCFAAVGATLFGDGAPVGLSVEQSFGYVEWLQRLTDADADAAVFVPSNR